MAELADELEELTDGLEIDADADSLDIQAFIEVVGESEKKATLAEEFAEKSDESVTRAILNE